MLTVIAVLLALILLTLLYAVAPTVLLLVGAVGAAIVVGALVILGGLRLLAENTIQIDWFGEHVFAPLCAGAFILTFFGWLILIIIRGIKDERTLRSRAGEQSVPLP